MLRLCDQPSMPDDHSAVEPPLPIPNRTVKRCSADDSGHSPVKVGHRQASFKTKTQSSDWVFRLLSQIFVRRHSEHLGVRLVKPLAWPFA